MPRTRHGKKTAMADVQQISDKVDEMKTKLFEELEKLKTSDPLESVTTNQQLNESADGNGGGSVSSRRQVNDDTTGKVSVSLIETNVMNILEQIGDEIGKLAAAIQSTQGEIGRYRNEYNLNSIVIYGLQEEDGERIEDKACVFIKDKVKVNITLNDIDYCSRLGRKQADSANRARPTLVRLTRRWQRNIIYNNKKVLKGTGYVIGEMLLREKLRLLKSVQNIVDKKLTWTWQGNVFVFVNNRRYHIDSEQRLGEVVGTNK